MKSLIAAFASLLTLTSVVVSLPAPAAMFKYNDLRMLDYDDMLKLVNKDVKKARGDKGQDITDQEAIEHLREAAKLIVSRPDGSDNMVAKLMPEVRKELVGYNAFEDTLSGLAAEAVAIAKDKKGAIAPRITAFYMLENLLSQMRPEVGSNAEMRRIVERIKAAKIKMSDDVKHKLKLDSMSSPKDPSEWAEEILKATPPPKEVKKSPVKTDED